MKKSILILTALIFCALTASAQKYVGTFTHVANSSALYGDLNRDALLSGQRSLLGVCGSDEALATLNQEALSSSGFEVEDSEFIFADGGALALVGDERSLPATWTETDGRNIRLRFTKIFSMSLEGELVQRDDEYWLLFPAAQFRDFMQHVICLVGRGDTTSYMEAMSTAVPDDRYGFRVSKNSTTHD